MRMPDAPRREQGPDCGALMQIMQALGPRSEAEQRELLAFALAMHGAHLPPPGWSGMMADLEYRALQATRELEPSGAA